jgi:hypothetical protein
VQTEIVKGKYVYPSDVAPLISHPQGSACAWEWLVPRYGITPEEIGHYGFDWSPTNQWLILPITGFDGGRESLLTWQAKTFRKGDPKYIGESDLHKHVFLTGWDHYVDNTNIVVVEDFVSAIKIGRYMPSLCLFGSSLLDHYKNYLRQAADKVIFWLDFDKAEKSPHLARTMELNGVRSACVITALDPKQYSDDEIAEYLKLHKDS